MATQSIFWVDVSARSPVLPVLVKVSLAGQERTMVQITSITAIIVVVFY